MSNPAAIDDASANEKNSTLARDDNRRINIQVVPRDTFRQVNEILEEAVEQGAFPGATLIVGKHGQEVFRRAVGVRSLKVAKGEELQPMQIGTVFDVASLTQQIVTTTLIMRLVEAGSVRLEDRVSRYLQGFSVYNKSPVTVGHLLAHCSGLAHWHPYFEELQKENSGSRIGVLTSRGAREYVYNALNRCHLKYQPGSKELFSDLGFIVLGNLIEVLTGLDLAKAAQRYVFQAFGLKSTSYIDLTMIRRRGIHPVTDLIAPTEECAWRKSVLCGEVQDDNAWAMGGVAGHAGLFSSVEDVHAFATEMLRAYLGQSGILDAHTVRNFWARTTYVPESTWASGWQVPCAENELAKVGFSELAIGHNSFTGCSLWIDPKFGLSISFLNNRVHPSRNNKKIRAVRENLFKAILEIAR